MADEKENHRGDEPQRIRLTTRLSVPAFDALAEIQRRHRRETGRAIPKWRVIDTAIIAYAERVFNTSESLTDGTVIQVGMRRGVNAVPLGSIVKHDAAQVWRDAVALAAQQAGRNSGVKPESATA